MSREWAEHLSSTEHTAEWLLNAVCEGDLRRALHAAGACPRADRMGIVQWLLSSQGAAEAQDHVLCVVRGAASRGPDALAVVRHFLAAPGADTWALLTVAGLSAAASGRLNTCIELLSQLVPADAPSSQKRRLSIAMLSGAAVGMDLDAFEELAVGNMLEHDIYDEAACLILEAACAAGQLNTVNLLLGIEEVPWQAFSAEQLQVLKCSRTWMACLGECSRMPTTQLLHVTH